MAKFPNPRNARGGDRSIDRASDVGEKRTRKRMDELSRYRPSRSVSPLVEFVLVPEDRTYYGAENPGPDSLPHHQRAT